MYLFPTRYKYGRSKGTHYNFVLSIRFQFLGPQRNLLYFVSGQWLRLWGKKNGFVTFSLNWKDSRPFKWLNWIQTSSSLLSLLKIVGSRISCEPGETANRETRVSRLCRSTLSGLGKDTTRYSWCDTRGLMSPLSKHISLHGKDLFINLWIDASPLWNKKYLK